MHVSVRRAQATGESRGVIYDRGFGFADPFEVEYDPEPRRPLVLDWDSMCPRCRSMAARTAESTSEQIRSNACCLAIRQLFRLTYAYLKLFVQSIQHECFDRYLGFGKTRRRSRLGGQLKTVVLRRRRATRLNRSVKKLLGIELLTL